MKTFAAVLVVFVVASFAVIRGQDFLPPPPTNGLPTPPPNDPPIANQSAAVPINSSQKINASLSEKVFHLKMTKQKREKSEVVLIFEFIKTIEPDALEQVRAAFALTDPKNEKENAGKPKVYLFDEDNVAVEIKSVAKTSGIITGRAGDAFRVHLDAIDAAIRKIEFRSDVDLPTVKMAVPASNEPNLAIGTVPMPDTPTPSRRVQPIPQIPTPPPAPGRPF
jgi:hypothetical protein